MNRRNFFKGVVGTLAACVMGRVAVTKASEVSKIEQWWKGAYPGTSFTINSKDAADCSWEELGTEIELYNKSLKRYLVLQGIQPCLGRQ